MEGEPEGCWLSQGGVGVRKPLMSPAVAAILGIVLISAALNLGDQVER